MIVLAVALSAAAGAAPAAFTAGATAAEATLRAEWHLDEGAPCTDSTSSTPDSSGNDIGLILRNTCDGPGRFGKAMRFPGDAFTTSALLAPQKVTVMLWVRADESPGPSRYVLSAGSDGCKPAAYGMYTSFAGDVNEGGLYFYVNHGGTGYHAPGVTAGQIWDGRWHMVTGTFDGSRARLYIDGQQIGSGTPVPGPIDYSQPDSRFVLGSYGRPGGMACAPEVPSVGFRGAIDEVRIYDGALGETTIQRISDYGGVNPPPPLPPDPPDVHTTGVDQLSSSGARVNGTIDDNGASVPFQVEYGKTTAYGQASGPQQTAGADGVLPVSVALIGLEPGTEYHARLVSGSVKGEDVTFRTEDARPAVPVTTIALDPARPGPGGFYDGFVNVSVTGAGRGELTTRCVLDPPRPPATFADLPSRCQFAGGGRVAVPGRHVVYAATRDDAGHTETPLVRREFIISLEPDTTITSAPTGETWRPNNLLYFTSTVLPATFECRLDGGAFSSCASPFETGTLAPGAHTFAVRAIAPGGAVDPTPAEASFTIAGAFSARADCLVQTVRYWLITGWALGTSIDASDKTL
jgi:hypothetical protein